MRDCSCVIPPRVRPSGHLVFTQTKKRFSTCKGLPAATYSGDRDRPHCWLTACGNCEDAIRTTMAWAWSLVATCFLVPNEAFVPSPAAPTYKSLRTRAQHEPHSHPTSRRGLHLNKGTAFRMAAGDEPRDESELQPTSDDPSVGIKAAW